MIKFFLKFILLIIAFACVVPMHAQMPRQKERLIMLKVVDLLDDYEHHSMIDQHTSEYSSSDRFKDLFVPGASIYNDLVALADKQYLTVDEYVSLLEQQSATTIVELRNIDKDTILYEEGVWRIKCHFEKYVNLTSQCGVELSTDFAYGQDYKIVATIIYDEESDQCFFESLVGEMKAERSFPDKYLVVKHNDSNDDKVLCDKKPLKFNPMGQAFVAENGILSFPDPEVRIKYNREKNDCNIVSLGYSRPKLRIRPYLALPIGDSHKYEVEEGLAVTGSTSEMGLDLGFLLSKSRSKFSFNLGVIYSKSSFDIQMSDAEYWYSAKSDADVDGDTYVRHYMLSGASESFQITSLGVPVYFDLDVALGRYFSMYFQGGVKAYMKMDAKLTDFNLDSYAYGMYSQYENLILDESWIDDSGKPYNQFGSHSWALDNVSGESLPVNSFYVDGFGGSGFRIKIPSIRMELEFGATYTTPIVKMWKNNDRLSLKGNVNARDAILSYTTSAGEKVKMLNTGIYDLVKNSIQLNIGLILKM